MAGRRLQMRHKGLSFPEILCGGDLRSKGRSEEAAEAMLKEPSLAGEAVDCLRGGDPVVRMRAADALEKASARRPGILHPYRRILLGMAATVAQKEVKWHLAQMIPRLEMGEKEVSTAWDIMEKWAEGDGSSIVRASSMQALAELAKREPILIPEARRIIAGLTASGTPAMRARGKALVGGL
jgi:hypothetical protein